MNDLFKLRVKEYFKDKADIFFEKLNLPASSGFFLNTNKASKEDILKLIDFDIEESSLSFNSYKHNYEGIGKTKAYELGLIYPQEIGASMSAKMPDISNVKLIVDMCSAPGGKTINILNRAGKDVICISNDVSYKRASVLSSNLERLGLTNVIISSKEITDLSKNLKGMADLVILDAPCSGEGMIRKYPEILDNYSLGNIESLAKTQKDLIDNAYIMLKEGGQLLYSTCTFAFEEDENNVRYILDKYQDMEMIKLDNIGNSTIEGTIKTSFIDDTEGQFISLFRKKSSVESSKIRYLKTVKDKEAEKFIKDNLNIDTYYLYKHNDHFYLSFKPLIDLGSNVLRYGICLGTIVNKRFEPEHSMFRSNELRPYFKNVYEINDTEYDLFVSGNEIELTGNNGYYLVTYKGLSLGYGKCSNNRLKNKYPKGLRRMI